VPPKFQGDPYRCFSVRAVLLAEQGSKEVEPLIGLAVSGKKQLTFIVVIVILSHVDSLW
jgi:hypothetical protein